MRFPLWILSCHKDYRQILPFQSFRHTGQFCAISIICTCQQFPPLTGREKNSCLFQMNMLFGKFSFYTIKCCHRNSIIVNQRFWICFVCWCEMLPFKFFVYHINYPLWFAMIFFIFSSYSINHTIISTHIYLRINVKFSIDSNVHFNWKA